jgi:hypothetical protein
MFAKTYFKLKKISFCRTLTHKNDSWMLSRSVGKPFPKTIPRCSSWHFKFSFARPSCYRGWCETYPGELPRWEVRWRLILLNPGLIPFPTPRSLRCPSYTSLHPHLIQPLRRLHPGKLPFSPLRLLLYVSILFVSNHSPPPWPLAAFLVSYPFLPTLFLSLPLSLALLRLEGIN